MDVASLVIMWNGEWNDNTYVEGNKMCMGAYKNVTFIELVETVYTVTGIDKTRYNINMHFVTEPSTSLPASEFLMKDDHGVKFIMFDESRYKVIYVDMICKNAGVSNLHSQPQNQLPSYSCGNQDAGVSIPFTCARSPLWNDDFGIHGMIGLSNDAAHTDDNHTDDGDNETNDNGDDSGGHDEEGASVEYPEVRFSGSQFEDNPLQGNWIVPGVENYAIEMDYRIRRSCTVRFEASCKDVNCKFLLRARCKPDCLFWHVVKFMPVHTCTPDVYDSHFQSVKAIVIESLFSERVASGEYTPGMLMRELLEQHGVQIMYTKAWRSLQHAKRLTYGNAAESFQQLPSYFHILKETNPDSITAIETDENNNFLYSFFTLGASLQDFRSYIRLVVAVDATHLKGEHKGVIFVATCKDGEEMIYPIVFGFGDGESDKSWIWYLTKLREAIDVRDDLVIVSNRHQSIANAMSRVFPSIPHVFCFFHLKQNLKKRCRQRKDVMDAFYRATYSYTTVECDTYLVEIQSMHPQTHLTLVEAKLEKWSHVYSPRKRYSIMTTNIAESLNKCMMKARRLPITSAHEFLRHMLQKWFSDRRAVAARLETDVTSAAVAHINFVHDKTVDRGCRVVPIIHGNKYLVKHAKEGDGIVDIVARTCSCRKWDLDQLPCLHAIAAGRCAYAPPINPLPNQSAWVILTQVRGVIVLLPTQRRQPSRPREGRIPSVRETRIRKSCGKCGAQGHNRLSCPNEWTSFIGESSIASTQESSVTDRAVARASRKCGICKETGHTRHRWPVRLCNPVDDNIENDANNQ
ncbi:uncharacterized protein LOC127787667 [Diospyros lotus]|uniref:uncharacterized protein LOC127787667 n=1 Tax=Diospyros lotus TaxID=55363 RepID=UPI00224E1FD8|nr:uncharacterized protein LOC127787667 [Diospyros lotus]